ncbi:MAG: GTPase Era [Lachnospirales bacterium]
MMDNFKSGFVSLIGRPNVGKSTLMNAIIGEKISIISNKPQTTRNKIQSIYTNETMQCIFIDTPGMHTPKSKLGKYMVKSANTTLNEVDIVLYLVEPDKKVGALDNMIIQKLQTVESPIFLLINKIDTISKAEILQVIDTFKAKINFAEIIPISAINGVNLDTLLSTITKYLPEGPKYFPEDMITDQPERQIVSEIIREKALQVLEDEIPHGIAVLINSMKSENNIVNIQATIFCEKESHKGIVIGKKGNKLKTIGIRSRKDIENLLGSKVFLETWVKVKKDWRDTDFLLKNFGYNSSEI